MGEDIFQKWERDDRAVRWAKARIMSARVVGWVVRHVAQGVCLGLGAWIGFALVGTKIVCS